MNIKLHTPQSLKTGSGMATVKQFLMSLLATSISIILTFGTAALIDNHKKEEARREMVIMILYDLTNSIEQIERADSMLRGGLEYQKALMKQPELFEQNPYYISKFFPLIESTETVEHIFETSIETINTINNVLFAEKVSRLYQQRKHYQNEVCNEFWKEIKETDGIKTCQQALDIQFNVYIYASSSMLNDMKKNLTLCKQMMEIEDADLEAYRQKRADIEKSVQNDSLDYQLMKELKQNVEQKRKNSKAAQE